MKWISRATLLFYILLSSACSKDNANDKNGPQNERIANFTVIGEDAENVYEYVFNANQGNGSLTDLSQEADIARGYLTLRELNGVLSFFNFSNGNFTLTQRNVITGAVKVSENFYSDVPERAILWGTNTTDKAFIGTYTPDGSRNLGVRTIDLDTGGTQDIFLENDIQTTFQPLYKDEKLFVIYQNGLGNFEISVIDTGTNSVIKQLSYQNRAPSLGIDDAGDVIVLTSDNGNDTQYDMYDINTLEIKEQKNISLNQIFSAGPLEGRVVDDKLYYSNAYSQPSPIIFGPALFDFDTDIKTVVDMIRIVDQIEMEIGERITLISQGYDPATDLFLIGYGISNTTNLRDGGVLMISTDGELVKRIEVPFIPTYFVKMD
ncbi:hypothetical protein [Costertonia aggregata]|uniref:Uncharacterized protein n=1 Tax=Costertonia aggregata TaxID=343403 RepID=A0A7H9API2_9FLAO|nr:hypothetical protein [Costertonia aggregata]QLG45368.1 hypothetical protein HYG79_08415 [Costertonia aggregata]